MVSFGLEKCRLRRSVASPSREVDGTRLSLQTNVAVPMEPPLGSREVSVPNDTRTGKKDAYIAMRFTWKLSSRRCSADVDPHLAFSSRDAMDAAVVTTTVCVGPFSMSLFSLLLLMLGRIGGV